MDKIRSAFRIFGVTLAALALASCGFLTGKATIMIDLGGARGAAQYSAGKSAPSNIVSYTITVTGEGMDPIVKDVPPGTGVVTLLVPPGPDRRIELEAVLDLKLTPLAHVYSYRGTAYADLAPNEVKSVGLRMIPGRTKLMIPDHYNKRIVQMNDLISGVAASYPPVQDPDFYPNDLDLDANGRLYIAYEYNPSVPPYYFIVRLNGIDDTSPVYIPVSTYPEIICIDKSHNLLYYFNQSSFYLMQLKLNQSTDPPEGEESIDLALEGLPFGDGTGARGIEADSEGNIYFTMTTGDTGIVKIDPSKPPGSRFAGFYQSPGLTDPYDLSVKDQYIYVSNFNGANGLKLMTLSTKSFSLTGGAGNGYAPPQPPAPSSPLAGDFYGPGRFIGLTNKDIFIIDETTIFVIATGGYLGFNRIVSFSDLDWNNWTVREVPSDGLLFYDQF